jgi:glycosyltransferase involved in cell wall biosynthesis
MKSLKIGIAVIAKNEADRIGRLLMGATFADEIVVVDSGSTDGTQALCEKMGAKVLFNEWPGYAAQKQFALEAMTADWILNLDADEVISEELAREIKYVTANVQPDVCAFSMPRLSWYLGRWIKHGGWYPDRKVRLVRRGQGKWDGDTLHEHLVTDGKTLHLSNPILHYVYRGISDQLNTINRFSDIYAATRGPSKSWFVTTGIVHAIGKFAECYAWKLGFLDGVAGLVIAMNSAWYVFLKHAKAWELSLHEEDRSGN